MRTPDELLRDIEARLSALERTRLVLADIPPGVTDHGLLTGLADDDHTQYLTNARGDARYLSLSGGTVSGTVSATLFSGSGASLTNLPAANLTGTVASARLSGAYSGITGLGTLASLSVTGTATAGTFSGSGASLTSLNAANLSSGIVPDARLPMKWGKTLVTLGTGGQGTIPHGLGAIPAAALATSAAGSSAGGDTVVSVVVFGVDATNITVRAYEIDGVTTTGSGSAMVSSIFSTQLQVFWLVIS